jgi:hypothetical protein
MCGLWLDFLQGLGLIQPGLSCGGQVYSSEPSLFTEQYRTYLSFLAQETPLDSHVGLQVSTVSVPVLEPEAEDIEVVVNAVSLEGFSDEDVDLRVVVKPQRSKKSKNKKNMKNKKKPVDSSSTSSSESDS